MQSKGPTLTLTEHLEENTGANLYDWIWQWFLTQNTKSMETQEKHKLELPKIKKLYIKDTMKRVKRRHGKWEKLYANHI